jgi:hypothetical protein
MCYIPPDGDNAGHLTSNDSSNGNSGTCPLRFGTKDGTCFGPFSEENEDTAPFGPANATDRYKWVDGLSPLEGIHEWAIDYGTGGYIVDLPQVQIYAATAWSYDAMLLITGSVRGVGRPTANARR